MTRALLQQALYAFDFACFGMAKTAEVEAVRDAIRAHLAAPQADPVAPDGDVVVSYDEAGQIVCVTRQDADGQFLSVIAESSPIAIAQPPAPTAMKQNLLDALERAGAAESALRRLIDECESELSWSWGTGVVKYIDGGNKLLARGAISPPVHAIPDGMCLAPIEATDAMVSSVMANNYVHGDLDAARMVLRDEYRAMIAAALAQPVQPAPEPVAWRIKRPLRGGGWEWLVTTRLLDDWINEPLYTHPAAPPVQPAPNAAGPKVLWLQLHGDCTDDELMEPVDYTCDAVTWCWHAINESDVRYVRADLAATVQPAVAEPLTDAQIDALSDAIPVDDFHEHRPTWHLRLARAIELAHGIGDGK